MRARGEGTGTDRDREGRGEWEGAISYSVGTEAQKNRGKLHSSRVTRVGKRE